MLQRFLLGVSIALSVLILCAGSFAYYAYSPQTLPATPYSFTIQSGSSVTSAAQQMQDAQVIKSKTLFVFLVRIMGSSSRIKSGQYTLEKPLSPRQLVALIVTGESTSRQITIIEGWTFKQFRAALDAHPDLKHDTIALSDAQILEKIDPSQAHPEGLFFPDTYAFEAGSSDVLVLKRAYQTMQKRLATAWQQRAPDLPLQTPYQALILASIVEKETGSARDREMIAGVFINRLNKGMRLQTDPSVIYGLGEHFDGNLRKVDLQTDTAYNTYTRNGLTPTPISLPGAASLHAALHPAQTTAVYFVAKGDGSSHFSSNLTEHNRAVNRFQK
jgi:UPF0755 protein